MVNNVSLENVKLNTLNTMMTSNVVMEQLHNVVNSNTLTIIKKSKTQFTQLLNYSVFKNVVMKHQWINSLRMELNSFVLT